MKTVLITTALRGVWCAKVAEDADLTARTLTDLHDAIMVISWSNGKGLQHICAEGSEQCKLGTPSDILVLHEVTAVFDITEKAAATIWT